ncbi:MAG: hypothetical protein IJA65_02785, partial [Acholeplasmatales bacterium]|nr:hypothetical protein [Acholeplasmatales bacterium]
DTFDVSVVAEDKYLDISTIDSSKISVETADGTACESVFKNSFKSGSNGYKITLSVSNCTGEGNVKIVVADDLAKDYSNNGSSRNTFTLSNVSVSNAKFEREGSISVTEEYLSYDVEKETIISIPFNKAINSIKTGMINLSSEVSAYIVSIERDTADLKVLKVKVKVTQYEINGEVVLKIDAGALEDVYGNTNEGFILATGVQVLNGKYEVEMEVSDSGCEVNAATGLYYCLNNDALTITATSNRKLNGASGAVATLGFKIGSNQYGLTSELIGEDTFIFEIELSEQDSFAKTYSGSGMIVITGLTISDFTDNAGNGGKYNKIDLNKYYIDLTTPQINDATLVVSLGDAYDQNAILNKVKVAGVTGTEYTISNNACVLEDDLYYSVVGNCNVEVTAIAISGTRSTATVVVTVRDTSYVTISLTKTKENTYGESFAFDKNTELTIGEIPEKLSALGVTRELVLNAISASNIVIKDETCTVCDAGTYTLTMNTSTLEVNGRTISIDVKDGVYKVKLYELKYEDIAKAKATVSKVYDGAVEVEEYLVGNCGFVVKGYNNEEISFTCVNGAYKDKHAGSNKQYTIYGIQMDITDPEAKNYKYVGEINATFSDGIVTKRDLDLGSVVIKEVSKIVDGTDVVLQNGGTYTTEIGDVLTFSWDSAVYTSVTVGENIPLTITGRSISGVENYNIIEGKPKGKIVNSTASFGVDYDLNEELYTNADVAINIIDYHDEAYEQYKKKGGNKPVYKYDWYVCISEQEATSDYSTCLAHLETENIVLDIDIYTGKDLFVYSIVTNSANVSTERKEFKVHMNNEKLKITSIETASATYQRGDVIAIDVKLNHSLSPVNVELGMKLMGDLSYVLNFTCMNSDEGLVCYYQVTSEDEPDLKLQIQSLINFDRLVDVYGNGFEDSGDYSFDNKAIVNIDTSAGTLDTIKYLVNNVEHEGMIYTTSDNINGKLKATFKFGNEIQIHPTSVTLKSNTNKYVELECVLLGGNKTLECSNGNSSFAGFDGELQVAYFGITNNELSQTVVFADGFNNLVLNAEYVSSILEYKLTNKIYIDDNPLTLDLQVVNGNVKDVAYIDYMFNKELVSIDSAVDANGYLTQHFNIVCVDGSECNAEGITITLDGNRLKVTSIYSGSYRITLNNSNNEIRDFAGNRASSSSILNITFDVRDLRADKDNIIMDILDNCFDNSICGVNGKIEITIPFIRELVSVNSKLYYKIGNSEIYTIDGVLSNGKLVFEIVIIDGDGELVINKVEVYSAIDVLNDFYGNKMYQLDVDISETTTSVVVEGITYGVIDGNVYSGSDNVGYADYDYDRVYIYSRIELEDTNVIVDTTGVNITGVTNDTNGYKNNGVIAFTVTIDEEINGFTLDKDSFVMVDENGEIYRYAHVESVDKVNNTTLTVNVRITEDATNGSMLYLRVLTTGILDVVKNPMEENYTDDEYVTVDNEKPEVTIDSLADVYYSSLESSNKYNVTFTITVFDAVGNGDNTKVCLYNIDANEYDCNNVEEVVEFDGDNKWSYTVNLLGLANARYKLVLKEGFIKDRIYNLSSEVESNIFEVSNELEKIEIKDINLISFAKDGVHTRYYYLSNVGEALRFNIEGFSGNACSYIEIYDMEDNKVTNAFECNSDIASVELDAKEVAEEKEYYFVIKEDIIRNKYGNITEGYNGKGKIGLIVNKPLALPLISFSSIVHENVTGEVISYYTKEASLNITYTFTTDIKNYSINRNVSSVQSVGTKVITLSSLVGSNEIVFTDHYGYQIDYKIKVTQDNKGPNVVSSDDNTIHYIRGDQESISIEFNVNDNLLSAIEVVEKAEYYVGLGFEYSYENGVLTITKEVTNDFNGTIDFVVPAGYFKDELDNECSEVKISVFVNDARFTIEVVDSYEFEGVYYVKSLTGIRFKLVPASGVVIS